MRRLSLATAALALGALTTVAAHGEQPLPEAGASVRGPAGPAPTFPGLRVTRVTGGLDHPWAVHRVGRRLLVTQRDRARVTLVWPRGAKRNLRFAARDRVWVSGETGLMGLEVDPRFSRNKRIYTCSGWRKPNGGHHIRVTAWKVVDDMRRLVRRDVLARIPNTHGRHGGCQLLIARSGALLVGTGDSAVGRYPQAKWTTAGKVLRIRRWSGEPYPGNPWADGSGNRRLLLTYGHRNIQGLAQRGDGSLWSVEHGTYRDDEVNLLRSGGNYGYHPVPGYNESVPMTDFSLPGEVHGARWSSGEPTLATSGAAFVRGAGWQGYRGSLGVAALAARRVVFMRFDGDGQLRWTRAPRALRQHGRLRGVANGPGGSLLVTTDNGGGNDAVLRVRPRR